MKDKMLKIDEVAMAASRSPLVDFHLFAAFHSFPISILALHVGR